MCFVHGRLRSVWRFLIAIAVVLLANLVGGVMAYTLLRGHPLAADAAYRAFALALVVGGFAVMLRGLDQVEGSALEAQGLGFGRGWLRDAAIGFGLGMAVITLAVAAIGIWGDLDISIMVSAATLRHSASVLVLLAAGAALEEVVFRGYPFQRLVESVGAWGAIIALSVLFGAVHLGNPNSGGVLSWGFFNTIAVGVLLALAYLRTGSLWMPIGFHFAWNFALGFVYGLPVSGMNIFSTMVRTKASGPALLTGGAYGIESSLTGAVVIVLGTGVVLLLPRRPVATPTPGLPGQSSFGDGSVQGSQSGI